MKQIYGCGVCGYSSTEHNLIAVHTPDEIKAYWKHGRQERFQARHRGEPPEGSQLVMEFEGMAI